MSACQGLKSRMFICFLLHNFWYKLTVSESLLTNFIFNIFFQKMILVFFYIPLMTADLISFNRLRNNVRFFETSKNYDVQRDVSKKLNIADGEILKISRIKKNHDSRHIKTKWAKLGYRSRRHLYYKKFMNY